MLLLAQILFFTLALLGAYVYWVRPVLRSRAEFRSFYAQTNSWLAAIRLRFAGIKGKLAGGSQHGRNGDRRIT